MSILASLVRAYDRLPDAPPFGYSRVEIGYCIVLLPDGRPAFDPIDLRDSSGRKPVGRRLIVPTPLVQRTSGISANFLWDKTAYALGVTEGSGKRTEEEHEEFKNTNRSALIDSIDEGLFTFQRFLDYWSPERFEELGWNTEISDENIVFGLKESYHSQFLHELPEAVQIWSKLVVKDVASEAICLVSGKKGRIARSHPPIKRVIGAQSSGAYVASYNKDAFSSYGHEQGDNAQVSESAAFKYTTTLNQYLSKDSGHRIQIGDASTVFWADAGNPELAEKAESFFQQLIDPGDSEAVAAQKIAAKLQDIRAGKPLGEIEPDLEGVRFYVLGLAPNAARISIRFYFEDSFGVLTRNYQHYVQDMALEPPPRDQHPPLWRYLVELAVLGKRDNIPPNLAGEWMRAILSGTRYPMTLLPTVLQRIRSDGQIGALRVAILRALLVRNFNLTKEAPVALDTENRNKGYLLGRLFAVYERAQLTALGDVNASIKDKFYSSASAQPRKVFHMLDSGSANHLSKVGKQSPGYKVVLERTLSAIMDQMDPGSDPFPASLSAEEQALFGLGYYHQRSEFFRKTTDKAEAKGSTE